MDCINCEGRSGVLETLRHPQNENPLASAICLPEIRRIRGCKLCGFRWSTIERFEKQLEVVVKPKPKPKPKPKLKLKPKPKPKTKPKTKLKRKRKRKKKAVRVYTRLLLDRDDLDIFDDDYFL